MNSVPVLCIKNIFILVGFVLVVCASLWEIMFSVLAVWYFGWLVRTVSRQVFIFAYIRVSGKHTRVFCRCCKFNV